MFILLITRRRSDEGLEAGYDYWVGLIPLSVYDTSQTETSEIVVTDGTSEKDTTNGDVR